ncbi:hypothetical protein JAAARDRAFT_83105, partial [Jaapia argillacea MUCL 33604]
PPISNCHVLGKQIMATIKGLIEVTILPSWVSHASLDWGTAKCGKLKASKWCIIYTIHMPIALIKYWGYESTVDREHEMLDNFMDLVCTVLLANLHSISQDHVDLYRSHIRQYLEKLKTLYKDVKIKPIHHASLHVDDFLGLFGPVQSHSTPF